MDSPLPWYAPPSGLWFRGRCAVFFLQLTNIYGRPMMIHLQRDWCWYVEIDPVGRFSLWYFCLWKKCRTSWDLLIWNLIASMGGSRYRLVCQIFSINGIIGGGVIAPWNTDTSVVTTCPVQPVSLLCKKKTLKRSNFWKDNFLPKMAQAIEPSEVYMPKKAWLSINGYNWSIVYPVLLPWKFAKRACHEGLRFVPSTSQPPRHDSNVLGHDVWLYPPWK